MWKFGKFKKLNKLLKHLSAAIDRRVRGSIATVVLTANIYQIAIKIYIFAYIPYKFVVNNIKYIQKSFSNTCAKYPLSLYEKGYYRKT